MIERDRDRDKDREREREGEREGGGGRERERERGRGGGEGGKWRRNLSLPSFELSPLTTRMTRKIRGSRLSKTRWIRVVVSKFVVSDVLCLITGPKLP